MPWAVSQTCLERKYLKPGELSPILCAWLPPLSNGVQNIYLQIIQRRENNNTYNYILICIYSTYREINMLQTVKPHPRRWQRPSWDCGSSTVPPPVPPNGRTQLPSHQEGPHTVITDIFPTQHISVAAACQPEHGQSWSEGQQRENTLPQPQTKLRVTSTNEGGKALSYCRSS